MAESKMKNPMMTATILTFWQKENYGAVLQAVALQDTCKVIGLDVNLAKFEAKGIERSFLRKIKSLLWISIRKLLGFRERIHKTDEFRNRWISSSPFLKDKEDLYNYLDSRDICIIGSDQIWNPQIIIPASNPFLLRGSKFSGKKIAYAASFGIQSIQDKFKEIYAREIKKFHAISVREKTGLEILSSLEIWSTQVVLDPTLLLNKDQWIKKAAKTSRKRPYVLCYIMPGKKEVSSIYKIAKIISKQRGNIEIIYLGDREYKGLLQSNYDVSAGPSEFIRYFADATYIVTNSFHGTCFSVNFEKDFNSVIEVSSTSETRNSRIVDFLSLVGLQSRIIKHPLRGINSEPELDFSRVNYMKINNTLKSLREDSLKFLNSAIQTPLTIH